MITTDLLMMKGLTTLVISIWCVMLQIIQFITKDIWYSHFIHFKTDATEVEINILST